MVKRIKICTGPGCKAWDAEIMAKQLLKIEGIPVTVVKCMNKCGGGTSIRLKDRGKIFKLRDNDEVVSLIKGETASLTEAC
ncbi:hypothetical protein OAL04_06145 [Nitrospinae bacterium]|nr:hypothetical protein [Nitrospinota bacterium]